MHGEGLLGGGGAKALRIFGRWMVDVRAAKELTTEPQSHGGRTETTMERRGRRDDDDFKHEGHEARQHGGPRRGKPRRRDDTTTGGTAEGGVSKARRHDEEWPQMNTKNTNASAFRFFRSTNTSCVPVRFL
jgi:hypothetical protein